jgi:hydrogenase nickel incorporation protein HypA/HybF
MKPACRSTPYDPCPRCGGFQVQATGGTEMRVKELEIE